MSIPEAVHPATAGPGAPPATSAGPTNMRTSGVLVIAISTFTCPFCHLVFANRSEFADHLRREHPERQPAPLDSLTNGSSHYAPVRL